MSKQRDQWSSSLGFILAAAGSAVGLGNLWKFPYITWENHGGGFVLVYLVCIAVIGMPIMMAEILIGRRAQASPVPALEKMSKGLPGGKWWSVVGWMGVIAGLVILSFYAVVAGWSISSFINCINWSLNGFDGGQDFGGFVGNGPLQVGLAFVFSTVTAFIVMGGISGGIEKATKVLMPVLLGILVLLVLNSFTLDGASQALAFLFTPSAINSHGLLEALGHSFFTLSLGMGAMITYGSYMGRHDSIVKSSIAIVLLDTLIAIMACIIMFSILFTFPQVRDSMGKSTAGMLFVTLPQMFYTGMPAGKIFAPIFYVLVGFAALSSTISLLEVVVSLLVDKLEWTRIKSTSVAASTIFVFSTFCALSNGAVDFFSGLKPFGQATEGFLFKLNETFFANKAGFMNLFDHMASNWFLPVGGMLITLFVGWILPSRISAEELDLLDENGNPNKFFQVLLFSLRFLAPLAIGYIIMMVILGRDFS
ncbi:Sodium-dependent transporter [Sulfidibacter corallicola]|uniref:Sodium-dependent transporter n=1 Tax=Sulfidibacter corallicola TaxID=2818388 RepID=A0A8A4TR23_SULCO|nr:sodium-dependent transporter [Sulfidibacter corallicola]QTD51542.1 sodium-dependent transporter [Sulfidibacter corallicola]